jgi:hypothetical protein
MIPADRLAAALSDRYRIERELGQGGMANVAAAVAKALEQVPADRFETARAFADALVECTSRRYGPRLRRRRRRSPGHPASRRQPAAAYLSRMRDTTAEADEVQLDAIRHMAPGLRLAQALELSESVRRLALTRLRTLHPDRSDLELVELLLGAPIIPPRVSGPAA